ncbi:MAG: N(G),N(G)-dimethylarginine dimethylaminohydrolase [Deltaproteobacteria bacterium]|nr:N(G),N(G)-dimethylarginine dimethylaminohydrolase [Deltaproteobacteria bacterium]
MRIETRIALVRPVPASYLSCLRANPAPIDLARAVEQHEAYVRALEQSGIRVVRLPALDSLADSVFLEDTAVALGSGHVLLTRPGAASRVAEVACLAADLEGLGLGLEVRAGETRDADWTLDGGDVLRAGDDLFYVGVSARTNEAGVRRLEVACWPARVIRVPVGANLHLKSSVTLVSEGVVVAAPSLADDEPFVAEGLEVLRTPEVHGGNVSSLGTTVLVSSAAPRTAEMLAARGLEVITLELSEIHKGEGALTCLSLRLPGESGFST